MPMPTADELVTRAAQHLVGARFTSRAEVCMPGMLEKQSVDVPHVNGPCRLYWACSLKLSLVTQAYRSGSQVHYLL
eukprot:4160956-Amphidinium_carterae.2